MKILILHNEYNYAGGEDSVVRAEHELLAARHDVRLFKVKNNSGGIGSVRDVMGGFVNGGALCRQLRVVLYEFRPDVVHAHNIFYALGTRALDGIRFLNIPVVMTLHNYRPLCPAGNLFRNNSICRLCVDRKVMWPAAVHRCFKKSFVKSAALATVLSNLRTNDYWNSAVDRYICLTEGQKRIFVKSGFDGRKIYVKPNFVERAVVDEVAENSVLFLGRMSKEKGVDTLIAAASLHPDINVRYAGDGPEIERYLEAHNFKSGYLGALSREEAGIKISQSKFVVAPSCCLESFGLVLIEAFSRGRAAVASRIGAFSDIVEEGRTGLFFEPGNEKDLAEKMKYLWDRPELAAEMGRNARKVYEEKYAPEKNYEMLMEIYRQAIEERGRGGVGR